MSLVIAVFAGIRKVQSEAEEGPMSLSHHSKSDVLNLSVRAWGVTALAAVCFTAAVRVLDQAGLPHWASAFWPTPYIVGGLLGQALVSMVSRLPFDGYGLDRNARACIAMSPVAGAAAGGCLSTVVSLVLLDRNFASPSQSPLAMALIVGFATLTAITVTLMEAQRVLKALAGAHDAGEQ